MTSEAQELLPCPFCGHKAKLYGGPMAQETYSVWCTAPAGKRHHLDGLGYKEAEAIAAWNTRADLSPQWRPISEAPTDCTRVLAYVPNYGPTTAHYDFGKWYCHSCLNKNAAPTHFMPLPEAPK